MPCRTDRTRAHRRIYSLKPSKFCMQALQPHQKLSQHSRANVRPAECNHPRCARDRRSCGAASERRACFFDVKNKYIPGSPHSAAIARLLRSSGGGGELSCVSRVSTCHAVRVSFETITAHCIDSGRFSFAAAPLLPLLLPTIFSLFPHVAATDRFCISSVGALFALSSSEATASTASWNTSSVSSVSAFTGLTVAAAADGPAAAAGGAGDGSGGGCVRTVMLKIDWTGLDSGFSRGVIEARSIGSRSCRASAASGREANGPVPKDRAARLGIPGDYWQLWLPGRRSGFGEAAHRSLPVQRMG